MIVGHTYAGYRKLGLWFVTLVLAIMSQLISAHELSPSVVDAQLLNDGRIGLTIRLNLEAQIADISEVHSETGESANAARYNELRTMVPSRLKQEAQAWLDQLPNYVEILADQAIALDVVSTSVPQIGYLSESRDSVIQLVTQDAVQQNWRLRWDESLGVAAFRFSTQDIQDISISYLEGGSTSDEIDMSNLVAKSALAVFVDYIGVGFEHIIPLGLDHILFVAGLFLFSARLKPLLWQVTAFTLAHTLTLAMGMLGVISLPATIVEPLIAATIVYVAVENIVFKKMTWWRPLLVFCFGLLHGLGFASVLTEFGLSSQSFAAGLIGFNVGVELGQLAVILACFCIVGFWFRDKRWYHSAIVVNGSAAIALIGAYWFVERVFL